MRNKIKLIAFFLTTAFLLLLSSKKTVFAQTYTCNWNSTGCVTQRNCPSNCTQSIPCTSITSQAFCHDTQGSPLPCNCSQQLDLKTLYQAIQSKPGGFNFAQGATIGTIVTAILRYLFPIAGLIFLIIIIIAGFKFMTSAGDPKAAQSAKSTLTTGIIGFVIIFISYWLVQLLAIILGLGQISLIF
jgi:hypothetical protein